METAGYRIVQEAVTNVVRHAGVREVSVRIRCDPASLHLHVEDCGKGFDAAAALAARDTGGLAGMRERFTLLGGRFVLESAPGQGTRVRVELPVQGLPDS